MLLHYASGRARPSVGQRRGSKLAGERGEIWRRRQNEPVAIFSDEAVASSGARKLKDLGNKDRALFDLLAVVARSGTFSVKGSVPEASATPAAALIGAVAGFAAGGPVAAALAATAGALVGLSVRSAQSRC
jgi:hypothetical protein